MHIVLSTPEESCLYLSLVVYADLLLGIDDNTLYFTHSGKGKQQAGAELCQAQVELEVIVDVVEEAWS